jgi:hypothetical protein
MQVFFSISAHVLRRARPGVLEKKLACGSGIAGICRGTMGPRESRSSLLFWFGGNVISSFSPLLFLFWQGNRLHGLLPGLVDVDAML